ncbi:MAG: hypothetical protein K2X67_02980 [Burkholderiales bacterium]|nr:hypothetical protein [Burkholderiales bacterium]
MNRVFRITAAHAVPDGTLVAPFLNARDTTSGLPFDLIEGFSLAAGTIAPHSQSKIHVMPFVAQVTFVRHGALTVRMKAAADRAPYVLVAQADEAVLTAAGTLVQLINETGSPCEVLYIVSPAYVFEQQEGGIRYDDSVVLDEDWDTLAANGWRTSRALPAVEQRNEALLRLAATEAALRPL